MHEELIYKLRSTKSKSKRKMLDEAADVIEQLSKDFAIIDDLNHDKDIEIEDLKEKIKLQWIPVSERLPKDDELVLAIVWGRPSSNIVLKGAYELSFFAPQEGWILECYPQWEEAIDTLERYFDKSCRCQNKQKIDTEEALWIAISALKEREERRNPKTNADHIRRMTDEELVCFIDNLSGRCAKCEEHEGKNEECPIYNEGKYCHPKDIMNWLKQPYKGDKN